MGEDVILIRGGVPSSSVSPILGSVLRSRAIHRVVDDILPLGMVCILVCDGDDDGDDDDDDDGDDDENNDDSTTCGDDCNLSLLLPPRAILP
jgi:hypothetical protein